MRHLVETGTYLGDMVAAQLGCFDRIHSIELSKELAEAARQRFAGEPNVFIEEGDSATVLPRLLQRIEERCIFWLDGHYSEGITARGPLMTPILAELQAILAHSRSDHVVLIDDARCFDGTDDYPTLRQIGEIIAYSRPQWSVEVKGDIIRLHTSRLPG